ncbi:actin organization and endocytosis protein, partial [Linderina macrospora]
MKSKLSNLDLAKIWELADAQHTGSLTLAEFMLAMFLAQGRINGKTIPPALPSKIAAEIAAANNAAGASGFAQTNMPVPAPGYQAQPPPPVQPQIQSQMPVLGYQQQPQAMNVAMPTPSFYSGGQQAPTLVAPAVSAPVDVSPVQDFESRFPDIVPTGGVAASLSSAKQSFQQNLLSGRIGESEHKWAISTSEKAQYEAIFRRWDPGHRGVLKGDQAREVFAQSGLPQHELAKVWSLADINNQGELNLDEFSVAMHLIFRRIAGDQLPHALPQELVPRSSKDFMDSLVNMKEQLLFKDFKKTPVRAATPARAASVPIEEDEASYSAYKSANRRRNQAGSSRHGTSSAEPTPEATTPVTAESVEQLRKSISQRKDQIAALKASIESKQQSRAESRISTRWRIDELKREIEDLHRTIPDSTGGESEYSKQLARRAKLARGIDELTRNLPSMVTDYERLATELAETKRDVVRKRDAKENPSPGVNTAGMTEMEARAARLVAQRMAALTGQTPDDANGEANDRIKHEIERVDAQQREQLDRAKAVLTGMESAKKEMSKIDLSASSIGDTSKWQEGVGVTSEEVKELIERLKRIEKISKP